MCNLCRRRLALDVLDRMEAVETFFEVGVGRGDIAIALAKRGLRGRGIDLSEEAVAVCRGRIEAEGLAGRLEVSRGDLFDIDGGSTYDLAIAFEVLEHIEDDRGAVERLRGLLRPHGYLLVSVPAHRRKWGATDVWAGHVRRYERDELEARLRDGGFEVLNMVSYGFPLLNVTRGIRNLVYARSAPGNAPATERTARSGVSLPGPVRMLRGLVPAYAALVYHSSRPFFRSDLGEGYFAVARRAG